jgi:NAD(P)-dependent dehydrogenase (short-subunit alcohol dehydrogenase family)
VATGAILITGCSSGIGRAAALRLAARGRVVYATARRPESLAELERAGCRVLALDVDDDASARAAVDAVCEAEGFVAALVNNAGWAQSGAVEAVPIARARAQFETNVIGYLRMAQLVLPGMREAKRGRIVNLSSVAGRVTLPGAGWYSASKFAVEALTDSLRKELRPWGIHVAAVEPGSIATEIWDKGTESAGETFDKLPERGRELYGEIWPKTIAVAKKTAKRAIPPDRVAKVVEHALTARRPRTRYLVGVDARAQVLLSRLLPDRAMDAIEARVIGA